MLATGAEGLQEIRHSSANSSCPDKRFCMIFTSGAPPPLLWCPVTPIEADWKDRKLWGHGKKRQVLTPESG